MNRSKCTWHILISIVVLFEKSVQASELGEKAHKILGQLLDSTKYDPMVVPTFTNASSNQDSPVIVTVNMFVRTIPDIDEVKMQFSPQITFRQEWNDARLKFDDMNGQIRYLVLTDVNRIWTPGTFFSKELQGHFHDMIKPNVLVRIYPNGNVLYSIRLSLTLACLMDHMRYPHTSQICSIQFASYAYSTDDVTYLWKESDPVQISKYLHMPRYYLTSYLTKYCTTRTNTGEYSCLAVDMNLQLETSQFVWQLYMPSIALVISSWLSFWLHPKATIARATLIGIGTLLMLFVLTNFKLPPVSYTMLVNQWIAACYIFMFGALIEFVLVNSALIGEENSVKDDGQTYRWHNRLLSRLPAKTNKLDMLSRLVFPLSFSIFCIVYCWKVNLG